MSNKDYLNDNFSVETFIPEALRNQTVTTLVKNLFDRHLSKDESKSFYGYVGKKQTDPNDLTPFVKHSTEERRINNLHPLIRGEVGTETYVFSFNDVLNKCRQLGIDTDKFYEWGATTSFNFAPPIDLDKFINYKRYRWIAKEPTNPEALFYAGSAEENLGDLGKAVQYFQKVLTIHPQHVADE